MVQKLREPERIDHNFALVDCEDSATAVQCAEALVAAAGVTGCWASIVQPIVQDILYAAASTGTKIYDVFRTLHESVVHEDNLIGTYSCNNMWLAVKWSLSFLESENAN